MFEDAEIISCYTRQDAINDGMFVDVSETAKEAGIKFPVAVTSNLWNSYISPNPMPIAQDEQGRLWDVLHMFKLAAKNTGDSFMEFHVLFADSHGKTEKIKIWAVCEAQSPTDPSPAINIMLPEDY